MYALWPLRVSRRVLHHLIYPTEYSCLSQLLVIDIGAVRTELVGRRVAMGEIMDLRGVKYAGFRDPDGNTWTLQGSTKKP